MWGTKWFLKRNISCDACLLNELLETDAEDYINCLVSGRLTEETVGFPEWTAQFSVWKKTGRDISDACAIACQNCTVYSVFPLGMTSHSKIAQFNWQRIARFGFSTGARLSLFSDNVHTRSDAHNGSCTISSPDVSPMGKASVVKLVARLTLNP